MTERSMSTDPVFAAIEARKVTAAAAQAAKGDRELNRTCDADTAAVRKLVTTVPTTIYGVLALVQYVQECTADGYDPITEIAFKKTGPRAHIQTTGQRLWQTLAEALEAHAHDPAAA
jgi:hypothetical protein